MIVSEYSVEGIWQREFGKSKLIVRESLEATLPANSLLGILPILKVDRFLIHITEAYFSSQIEINSY